MEVEESIFGNYRLGETIGSGTTGKVKYAKHISTGKEYAIKFIKKSQFRVSNSLEAKTRREIALMKLLDHPHVLKLIECLESRHKICLVLEHAGRGELFDYLVSRGRLPRAEAFSFFRELVYGLDYLHEHGICHRDLKPENLLLDHAGHLKIADFGFARWMRANTAETACGSPHYLAPEIVSGVAYDGRKADVWSCGVILYALLSGTLPFNDKSMRTLITKVQSGRFSIPSSFDADVADLITQMLQVRVSSRITLAGVKQHRAFLHGLPDGYQVPAPIALRPSSAPIELGEGESDFLSLMTAIGYDSHDSVREELRSTDATPAKIFYRMWTGTADINSLPWHGGEPLPLFPDNVFIHDPRTVDAEREEQTDEFGRAHRQSEPSQSADSIQSAAQPIPWTTRGTALADAQFVFRAITQPLIVLTHGIQQLLRDRECQFFFPNDLEFIARKDDLIVRIVAEYDTESSINLMVSALTGEDEDLDDFVNSLERIIFSLLAVTK
jgi:BR serine/threonine kinase